MSSSSYPGAIGAGVDVDRNFVDTLRSTVAMTLLPKIACGDVDWTGWTWSLSKPGNPPVSPQTWVTMMCRPGEYVDQVWLQLAALYLSRDILLLPCFEKNSWNGVFRRLYGGEGIETPALGPPVLLGLLEEEIFVSPHFQVMVIRPSIKSDTLCLGNHYRHQ